MKRWEKNLAALVPYYSPSGGNCTQIYYQSGQVEEDKRTVKWNLRRLARSYCIDPEASRKLYGAYIMRHNDVPLPLSDSLILVSLKVRKVIGRNDGSNGYFNLSAIGEIKANNGGRKGTTVVLPGNISIISYFSKRTVEKRLKEGELIRERFISKTLTKPGLLEVSKDVPLREYLSLIEKALSVLTGKAGIDLDKDD